MAYKKSKIGGIIVQFGFIAMSTAVTGALVYKFNLTAGALSLENYYLFGMVINKPYTKFSSYGVGVYLAMIYLEILQYRKLKGDQEKKAHYPKIHFLHTSKLLSFFMIVLSFIVIIIVLFSSYPAVKQPYSWNMAQNVVFYSFSHIAYSSSCAVILLVIFLDNFNFAKIALSNPVF